MGKNLRKKETLMMKKKNLTSGQLITPCHSPLPFQTSPGKRHLGTPTTLSTGQSAALSRSSSAPPAACIPLVMPTSTEFSSQSSIPNHKATLKSQQQKIPLAICPKKKGDQQ